MSELASTDKSSHEKPTRWIWIDLEMTGLDACRDTIIEIATIITDEALNILAEGPSLAIYQPDSVLDKMDDWNQKHHGESGLLERVRASSISLEEAEKQTLEFINRWVEKGASPICGNTVAQDRRFLRRYMPTLEDYFHYRHLDVSTLKVLVGAWQPKLLDQVKKEGKHLALDDIKESIEELKFYRINCFKDVFQVKE